MAIVLGLNAKLLRGAAGSTGSTEVKNVKDLTLNLESGEADVTTRATGGWRATAGTLKEASLEFGILYDTEDADFQAFQAAYFSNTPIALFITDGAGSGLDADWSITAFTVEQPLEEAVSVSITAKPTASTRAPAWT
jgi:predicted secreted protein